MMLTYKRKLKLTKAQEGRISSWIGACRVVYNMGLEIKIASWRNRISVGKYDLINQLPTIKDTEWIKDVPAQSLQQAIERLDVSYKNFFRTCHMGGGFPKFANKRKYRSIYFKEVSVNKNVVKLPKIGELRMFKDSPIIGDPKTAQIIKESTGYFVCIQCDNVKRNIQCQDERQVLGIDMGVVDFCVDSNRVHIKNPKHFKKYERKLRVANRSLARKVRLSNRWKKQSKRVALVHHKIANVRKHFLHYESTKLAKKYHTIYVEDLKIKNMTKSCSPVQDDTGKFLPNGQKAKSGLNKAILDCGWGMFRDMLAYKTNVVRVNPKYTSQTCSVCGAVDSVSRISRSEFKCTHCGHVNNADENAAKIVLSRGTALVRQREALACA